MASPVAHMPARMVEITPDDLAQLTTPTLRWLPLPKEEAAHLTVRNVLGEPPTMAMHALLWWLPHPTRADFEAYAAMHLCFLAIHTASNQVMGCAFLEDQGEKAKFAGAYLLAFRGQPAVEASRVLLAWAHTRWPVVWAVTPFQAAVAHLVQVGGRRYDTRLDPTTGRRVHILVSQKE